jgi:hypothetical protein
MKKVGEEEDADRKRMRDFFDSIHFAKPVDWRNADTEPPDDDAPPRKSSSKPKQAVKLKKAP